MYFGAHGENFFADAGDAIWLFAWHKSSFNLIGLTKADAAAEEHEEEEDWGGEAEQAEEAAECIRVDSA